MSRSCTLKICARAKQYTDQEKRLCKTILHIDRAAGACIYIYICASLPVSAYCPSQPPLYRFQTHDAFHSPPIPASSLAKLAKRETPKGQKVRPWFGRHPSVSLGWMELCGHLKPHPRRQAAMLRALRWQCGEVVLMQGPSTYRTCRPWKYLSACKQ